MRKTVVFEPEDGRPSGVTYEAAENEVPVFSSGVPVRGWRKCARLPAGIAPEVSAHLWVADVPPGCGSFKLLFDGDREIPRSRGKGFYPLGETAPGSMWYATDPCSMPGPDGVWRPVIRPEGVEVLIIPIAPWAMNILPVESLDRKTCLARLAIPATYAPTRPLFGNFPGGSAWLENDLGLISRPGQWALDEREGKIYLWPEGDHPGDKIMAPALVEFVRVAGRLDRRGKADEPVRGIHFAGLTFTHGDRYTVPPGRTGLGVQHDWEQFDQPTAALRFRGAEDCSVRRCTFTRLGGTAIRLDLHCQKISVTANRIQEVGGAGVFLCGYGPGTKDVSRTNTVEHNEIGLVGRHYWDSPAIFVWQSGENRIAHNRISHTPYAGIVVSGRIVWDPEGMGECSQTIRWQEIAHAFGMSTAELRRLPEPDWNRREPFLHARNNLIEKNDISHVVETMSDGNAIYISGAGAGNKVRANFLHDIPSKNLTEVVRCDDDQHRTLIEDNVMFKFGGYATGVASKGINDIIGNLIIRPLRRTKRGLISLELGPVKGSRIRDNIVVATHRTDQPVFQKRSYGDGPIPRLADCHAGHNLYWNVADPEWAKRHLAREQSRGVEQNSHAVDPCFVNIEEADFRLRADSPLPTLGFTVPDVRDAGPHALIGKGNPKKTKVRRENCLPRFVAGVATLLLLISGSWAHAGAQPDIHPEPPLALMRVEYFRDTIHHAAQRSINELVDRGVIQADTPLFQPESPVTPEQFAEWAQALLGRKADIAGYATTLSLADARKIITAVVGTEWVPMPDAEPTPPLTRAQAAELLLQALHDPVRFAGPVTVGDLYVSPDGNDAWSGRLPEPAADGGDGPVASPSAARDRLRALRKEGLTGDATVLFRAGTYVLPETLIFGPEDGTAANETITWRNYGDEPVVLSGGIELSAWTRSEERPEGTIWQASLPGGITSVRQLFANNQRLPRARFPDVGYMKILAVDNPQAPKRFQVDRELPGGALKSQDAEFVDMSYWTSRRERIAQSGKDWVEGFTHSGSLPFHLTTPAVGNACFVENDLTLLNRPWEWCFDGASGSLLFMTPPDADPANLKMVAPRVEQLVRIAGSTDRRVRNLRFQGISFAHSAATMPAQGISEFQATFFNDRFAEKDEPSRVDRLYTLPAAIDVTYGQEITFSDVRLAHLGNQGINFGEGSRYSSLIGSEVFDVGGTGVMIGSREVWGQGAQAQNKQDGRGDWSHTAQVPYGMTISDNRIHDCGRIVFGGVGIWAGYTKFTAITHNDVYHLPYSGITLGWSFFSLMTSMEYPLIAFNHVHDVMRVLTDGGGIYVLGYQPGGVMRGNVIHDVWRNPAITGFFAHGLYFDEGSRFWRVEDNQVYDTFDDLHLNNFLRNPATYQTVDYAGNPVGKPGRVGGLEWIEMKNNRFGEPPEPSTSGLRPIFQKQLDRAAPVHPAASLFTEPETPKQRIIGEKTIANGGFENSALSGWRPLNDGQGALTLQKNDESAHSGNGFLRFERLNYADPVLSNPIAFKQGKTYLLRAWLRLVSGPPAKFRVYIESFGQEVVKDAVAQPGFWIPLEARFTVEKNINSSLVFQTLAPASGTPPFDLDDISISEIPELKTTD